MTIANVQVRSLGRTDYTATWTAMQAFTAARTAETTDEIWLTEHPPVYTLGLAGRPEHLLRSGVIPVVKVDRGGQITYHGPGQLVAYLLVDLRRRGRGIRHLVRDIEGAVIEFLATLGIPAWGKPEAPGVYVDCGGIGSGGGSGSHRSSGGHSSSGSLSSHGGSGEAKIAALGLRVRNGCTYHGLALNVAMDLAPFADINPCGYPGLAVTQLAAFGVDLTVEAAGAELAPFLIRRLVEA